MKKRISSIFYVGLVGVGVLIGSALPGRLAIAQKISAIVGGGTQGHLARWIDNGTLGSSSITEDKNGTVAVKGTIVFPDGSAQNAAPRPSRRAALNQWWTTTPHYDLPLGTTPVGLAPFLLASDGADLWVTDLQSGSVSRVRASDGKLLETWTGATNPSGVMAAMGRVFVTGETSPGRLYMIDPSKVAGPVTEVASGLGGATVGIAFDGSRIWTTDNGSSVASASISIVTPTSNLPWTVHRVFGVQSPVGVLYDGSNIWVTDRSARSVVRMNLDGTISQTVPLSGMPQYAVFDGANIWVVNSPESTIDVVRVSNGSVIATLTGNGLNLPSQGAYDGERILVTNVNSLSLWRAADLAPLGSFPTGGNSVPVGACSDGINFWVTLQNTNQLARF